jgi:hypothetical protein
LSSLPAEEAREAHPPGDPEVPGSAGQRSLQRPLAREGEFQVRARRQEGERVEQAAEALPVAEPADVEDRAAVAPDLARPARGGTEERRVDAVRDDLDGSRPDAVGRLELSLHPVRDRNDAVGGGEVAAFEARAQQPRVEPEQRRAQPPLADRGAVGQHRAVDRHDQRQLGRPRQRGQERQVEVEQLGPSAPDRSQRPSAARAARW